RRGEEEEAAGAKYAQCLTHPRQRVLYVLVDVHRNHSIEARVVVGQRRPWCGKIRAFDGALVNGLGQLDRAAVDVAKSVALADVGQLPELEERAASDVEPRCSGALAEGPVELTDDGAMIQTPREAKLPTMIRKVVDRLRAHGSGRLAITRNSA